MEFGIFKIPGKDRFINDLYFSSFGEFPEPYTMAVLYGLMVSEEPESAVWLS